MCFIQVMNYNYTTVNTELMDAKNIINTDRISVASTVKLFSHKKEQDVHDNEYRKQKEQVQMFKIKYNKDQQQTIERPQPSGFQVQQTPNSRPQLLNSNSTGMMARPVRADLLMQQPSQFQPTLIKQFPMYNSNQTGRLSMHLSPPPTIGHHNHSPFNAWQQDPTQYRVMQTADPTKSIHPPSSLIQHALAHMSPQDPSSLQLQSLSIRAPSSTQLSNSSGGLLQLQSLAAGVPGLVSTRNEVANSWSTSILPRGSMNERLPKLDKKRGKGGQAIGGGTNSHSAEVFGSKSLKSIMHNIEMVEEQDNQRKKTRRRFQQQFGNAGASDTTVNASVKQIQLADKKPPIPFAFSQIRVLQVESNDDQIFDIQTSSRLRLLQTDSSNTEKHLESQSQTTSTPPQPKVAFDVSPMKHPKEFLIKSNNLKSSRERAVQNSNISQQVTPINVVNVKLRTNASDQHIRPPQFGVSQIEEEIKVSQHDIEQFFRRVSHILCMNQKSCLIKDLVKLSSKFRVYFSELQRAQAQQEGPSPTTGPQQQELSLIDDDESKILEVSFVSKDFGGQTHQSATQNHQQVINQTTEEQKQNESHADGMDISNSQARPSPFPVAPPPITYVEGSHEKIHYYLEYERVYLVRDQGPIIEFSHDQQSHNNKALKIDRKYIIRKQISITKHVESKSQLVVQKQSRSKPSEKNIPDFVECSVSPCFRVQEILNLEKVGLAQVYFSLLRDFTFDRDTSLRYETFTLDLELKPANRLVGPLTLSKLDLKLALRDILLMTSLDRMKKGDTQAKYSSDSFALERIAKLVTSSAEAIEKYLTKEVLLKVMKSAITNNTVIVRRRTGKSLALTVNNESLKRVVCVRDQIDGKPTSQYSELLQDTQLMSCQSLDPLTRERSVDKRTAIRSDSHQILLSKAIRLKEIFFVATVSFNKLQNRWALNLYAPKHQKTYRANFSFKQLKKVHKLFQLTKEKEAANPQLGITGLDNLDVTNDRTYLQNNSLAKRQMKQSMTKNNLRALDRHTGAFHDKDVSADFSINKTQQFLMNNGNFNTSINQNSMLKTTNNNLRYIDLEHDSSMQQSSKRTHPEDIYRTPPPKIVLGRKSLGHKMRLGRTNNNKMFNNSYLNCYFQIHDETKKKLEKTNMSFGDSIQTKGENDSMFSLSHENVFNQPQRLSFWKKLLQSLSFCDISNTGEEDEPKETKLMIRIQNEGKCFSRKLHQVLLEEEVEKFSNGPKLDLVQYVVSLETQALAQENPYEGDGVVQRIREHQDLIKVSESLIKIKQFNVSRGTFTKKKLPLRDLLNSFQQPKEISLGDLQQAIRTYIFDADYHQGQKLQKEYVEAEDFEYKPKESRLVLGIIQDKVSKNILLQKFDKAEIQRARDEFLRMKRNKTMQELSPQFEKMAVVMVQADEKTQVKEMVRLRVQVFFTESGVVIRVYDPALFFKADFSMPHFEIQENYGINQMILIQATQVHQKLFHANIAERLLIHVEEQILVDFKNKFYQQHQAKKQFKQIILPNNSQQEPQFIKHLHSVVPVPKQVTVQQSQSGLLHTLLSQNPQSRQQSFGQPFLNPNGSGGVSHAVQFNTAPLVGPNPNLILTIPNLRDLSISKLQKTLFRRKIKNMQQQQQQQQQQLDVTDQSKSRIFVGKKKKKKKKKKMMMVIPKEDIRFHNSSGGQKEDTQSSLE